MKILPAIILAVVLLDRWMETLEPDAEQWSHWTVTNHVTQADGTVLTNVEPRHQVTRTYDLRAARQRNPEANTLLYLERRGEEWYSLGLSRSIDRDSVLYAVQHSNEVGLVIGFNLGPRRPAGLRIVD